MIAAAWILIFPLVLFHQGSALLLDPDCGYVTPLAGSSPWMAEIITTSKRCSGALIDNQHVITTASCIINDNKALVRLGDFNKTNRDLRMYEDYYVRKAIVHILYNETTYLNDIALLKLQNKVGYKPHIRPICLSLNANTKARAGNVQEFNATLLGLSSPQLRNPETVTVHRLHPNQCHDIFLFPLQRTQICAKTKNAASCVETGGPLGINLKVRGSHHYSLVGIQSYGNLAACVYTNIMSYVDWIVENILDAQIIKID